MQIIALRPRNSPSKRRAECNDNTCAVYGSYVNVRRMDWFLKWLRSHHCVSAVDHRMQRPKVKSSPCGRKRSDSRGAEASELPLPRFVPTMRIPFDYSPRCCIPWRAREPATAQVIQGPSTRKWISIKKPTICPATPKVQEWHPGHPHRESQCRSFLRDKGSLCRFLLGDLATEDITIKLSNSVPLISRNYNRRMISNNYLCHDLSLLFLA